MDFHERDPTNPIKRKLERDQELREGLDPDTVGGSFDDLTDEERESVLKALERKYGSVEVDEDADDEIDCNEREESLTAEQAREWGKRDGRKAVELAQEQPEPGVLDGMIVGYELSAAMDLPPPDEPRNPARLLCTERDYVNQGIYFGPDVPLIGLVSKEAGRCFRASEEIQDAYFDAFDLELRRANVAVLTTGFGEIYDDREWYSLYVVDNNRYPIWNQKTRGSHWGDQFVIHEPMIQTAFLPEKKKLRDRVTGVFKRSG